MSGYGWMLNPLLACLILTGIHSYLGVHILARGVIFVDLALAQIAALGAVVALLAGLAPGSWQTYVVSLVFAAAGAGFFALSRGETKRVPQEAIIGIAYAVATAAAILAMDLAKDPHGAEHIQAALAGNIVWVSRHELIKAASIYAVVGLFHWRFRENFLAISMDAEAAQARGLNVVLWDFLFYLSFAVVITSSVAIAGVLLVFCYLIVPAVFAVLLADSLGARLAIGWTVGTVVSVLGIGMSYDHPSGPVVACLFGIALLLAGAWSSVSRAANRGLALLRIAGMSVLFAAILIGVPWLLSRDRIQHGDESHHEHHLGGPPDRAAEIPKAPPTNAQGPAPAGEDDELRKLREAAERALGK